MAGLPWSTQATLGPGGTNRGLVAGFKSPDDILDQLPMGKETLDLTILLPVAIDNPGARLFPFR